MKEAIFPSFLWLALAWPLVLSLRVALRPTPSPSLDGLWCTAPLPALALALLMPEGDMTLAWWLLGGHWLLDDLRRPLLAFAALLWGLAGLYAKGYLATQESHPAASDPTAGSRLWRFALFWLLTLAGNLLLILSEDIASFYLGFSLMTLAAYGLVVNADTRDARTGGLAYLIMGVLGEGLILAGLLWAAGSIGTTTLGGLREGLVAVENGVWMGMLLWLGFGIKTGVIGLHFWLPLAHGVAPTPASAVLSGVMIKAGLLGWLLTLPLGEHGAGEGFRLLGQVMVIAGLLGALGAAVYGAVQRHPKAVLAYSSISQMGMLTALVAMGLVAPETWPALSSAVLLFAAHHGLTKGALFLGVGIAEHPPRLRGWLLAALLTLPALSLTGMLGSGLATKWAFKSALYDAGHEGLVIWLSLAAVGTTMLMARTLWLQWAGHSQNRRAGMMPLFWPMPLAWLATLMAAVSLPWWLPVRPPAWPSPSQWLDLWWPVALGLGVCLSAWGVSRHRTLHLIAGWHAGDLWWPLAAAWQRLTRTTRQWISRLAEAMALTGESLHRVEEWLIERADMVLRGETGLRRHLMVLMTSIAVLVAILLLAGDA